MSADFKGFSVGERYLFVEVDYLERLTAERDRLRAALRQIAYAQHWNCGDLLEVARAALAESEGA